MGMTIDEYITKLDNMADLFSDTATELCRYQLLKDKYEKRLRTEMINALAEIYLEIKELSTSNDDAYLTCADIIHQKIDKLQEEEDGNDA